MLRVVPQPDATGRFEWSDPMVAQLQVDKGMIIDKFEASAAEAGGATGLCARIAQTHWCP